MTSSASRVLFLDGHPDATPLCAGLASAAAEGAQARGDEVRLLRLTATALDPIVAEICPPTVVDDCRRESELLYQSLV
jgi:putative NADPH-quinone reductase